MTKYKNERGRPSCLYEELKLLQLATLSSNFFKDLHIITLKTKLTKPDQTKIKNNTKSDALAHLLSKDEETNIK